MASFIPHHTKRDAFLKRKEDALVRLVQRNADQGKLLRAAEAVRNARVAALRAKLATRVPRQSAPKIQALIQAGLAMPPDQIIAEFSNGG